MNIKNVDTYIMRLTRHVSVVCELLSADIDDHFEVMDAVHDVASRWKSLGAAPDCLVQSWTGSRRNTEMIPETVWRML